MEEKKKSNVGFIIGSLCVAACAVIVVPKAISALSNYLYSKQLTDIEADDDDWGPVIEKKQDDNKEEQNGEQ